MCLGCGFGVGEVQKILYVCLTIADGLYSSHLYLPMSCRNNAYREFRYGLATHKPSRGFSLDTMQTLLNKKSREAPRAKFSEQGLCMHQALVHVIREKLEGRWRANLGAI